MIPLLLKRVNVLNHIDFLFSYRFASIRNKIESVGLHLLPLRSDSDYFQDGIVVDNGFAFIAIRYGIVMLMMVGILVYCLAKEHEDHPFVLCAIIIVSLVNFIDNDIFDYCCLPFVLIALKNTCVLIGKRATRRIPCFCGSKEPRVIKEE